jgi:hypothetical protein
MEGSAETQGQADKRSPASRKPARRTARSRVSLSCQLSGSSVVRCCWPVMLELGSVDEAALIIITRRGRRPGYGLKCDTHRSPWAAQRSQYNCMMVLPVCMCLWWSLVVCCGQTYKAKSAGITSSSPILPFPFHTHTAQQEHAVCRPLPLYVHARRTRTLAISTSCRAF